MSFNPIHGGPIAIGSMAAIAEFSQGLDRRLVPLEVELANEHPDRIFGLGLAQVVACGLAISAVIVVQLEACVRTGRHHDLVLTTRANHHERHTRGLAVDLAEAMPWQGNEYFERIVQNNTVNDILVGIPWFTDAGLLYTRTDLGEEHELTVVRKGYGCRPVEPREVAFLRLARRQP